MSFSARSFLLSSLLIGLFSTGSCKLDAQQLPHDNIRGSVGFDINIENSAPTPLVLVPGKSYYVDEIRLAATQFDFPKDTVIDWLGRFSDFSVLDWTGMIGVRTQCEEQEDGSYTATCMFRDANWMHGDPSFSLEFQDEQGTSILGPIMLTKKNFAISRLTSFWWADGATGKDDLGSNQSTYFGQIEIATAGTFTGPDDDIYIVEVATAGPLDGTATVDITSVRGDERLAVPVTSGQPIDLGAAGRGATITFTEVTADSELIAKDRWTVDCSAGSQEVGAPQSAKRAGFSAMARILFSVAKKDSEVFEVPWEAESLKITWSANPAKPYVAPIEFNFEPDPDFGFEVEVSLSPPADGAVYQPGESVEVSVNLFDGAGNQLHPDGQLPTYRQFLEGESNGIQYFHLSPIPCLAFFSECRLDLMEVAVAGPKHRVEQNYLEGPARTFFTTGHEFPEVWTTFVPDMWDMPIANKFTFELPADAHPGTYVVLAKASRNYLGETSNRMKIAEFQVGTRLETQYRLRVGNCKVCHFESASLKRLRHGVADVNTCRICHLRDHGTACEHLHTIHFFSPNFRIPRNDCSLCHLSHDSNSRASMAICSSCHGSIHPAELELEEHDPYAHCGTNCHKDTSTGHIPLPPL
jgi:hypothetical protein